LAKSAAGHAASASAAASGCPASAALGLDRLAGRRPDAGARPARRPRLFAPSLIGVKEEQVVTVKEKIIAELQKGARSQKEFVDTIGAAWSTVGNILRKMIELNEAEKKNYCYSLVVPTVPTVEAKEELTVAGPDASAVEEIVKPRTSEATTSIKSLPQVTQVRFENLKEYFRQEVMSDRFICKSCSECKTSASYAGLDFYEGQLHHVGSHYDLEIDGEPMRVVIVGQEYGHDPSQVDLDKRRSMIFKSASVTWRQRNPHMKGTTTLLRLVHRRAPGDDSIGEHLTLDSGETIHLFEGFALVNYLLCSAVEKSSAQGKATYSMTANCARHFKKAIEILRPTLVILQGYGVRRWIAEAYNSPWNRRENIEWLNLDGRRTSVLTFYHPSYRGCQWGRNLQLDYLNQTIIPTIARARL
jgi:hypothetical protein